MEAIVFDFKNSLKTSTEQNIKKETSENKNFSSTLENVNNKTNSKISSDNMSRSKESKNTASKDKDISEHNKDVNQNVEIEEDDKENYSLAYGNIPFFFSNLINTVDESINNEAIELETPMDIEPIKLEETLENNLIENEEVIMENQVSDIIIKEDMEMDEINKFQLPYKENAVNNNIIEENKLSKNEIEPNFKLFSKEGKEESIVDMTMVNQNDLMNIKELDEKMEFNLDQKNNHEVSSAKESLDINETKETDKDTELGIESFISMNKNEIRFEKDNLIKLDDLDTVRDKDVIQQIVEKAKFNLSDNKNEMRIKLKPEILGEMTMNIEVVKGTVIAKIMVDNQRAKEIIEGNLIQLKEGIKDTGLEIKTVEVFVGNNSDFDKHNSGQFNLKQNNKRIKVKSQDRKAVSGYDEQTVENMTNINTLEEGLNLFA
ncbi:flagellar hook-length control protein FliK [Tissierella praeacuta]|uniref:flagellar hook-length control protein FliK n=1 Tax=Tissierella praeacuta TaxID=43131 RepID=UPI00104A12DC|nr:flagellar hook-length control protein FliK [Tissierella praeacuta]TCU70588.1 flagellar hook-length control protein FliK [Tissierella praeacuta]